MERSEVWVRALTAAIGGSLASETEGYNHGHRANIAERAGICADFALGEYDKRFAADGKPLNPRSPTARRIT